MVKLNFPTYSFRIKNSENAPEIFDEIRKKFVILQPEEWVRQHVIKFLIDDKNYPLGWVNVEKQLTINGLKKRCDVIVFDRSGTISILVECKAPDVSITQSAFDQIAQYNLQLKSDYLMVTNGMQHYFCKMDYKNKKYIFLEDIPSFKR